MITETQDRCHYIGGSEAHYIYMNYESKGFRNWWYNKLNGINDEPFSNIHMDVGTILESDVIDLYESMHGTKGIRDDQRIKGLARANTDFIYSDKISDVKVSKKAEEWAAKGKVPIKYKRQLIHYLFVYDMGFASIIAYQCTDELLENPFMELSEDNLYEIDVPVTAEEISTHKAKIEYLEHCKEKNIYPEG